MLGAIVPQVMQTRATPGFPAPDVNSLARIQQAGLPDVLAGRPPGRAVQVLSIGRQPSGSQTVGPKVEKDRHRTAEEQDHDAFTQRPPYGRIMRGDVVESPEEPGEGRIDKGVPDLEQRIAQRGLELKAHRDVLG